jgi:hypothetical protein
VKYSTAVARLRSCAADLDRLAGVSEEPLLFEAWVFGELLDLPDQLDVISLALMVDLPADDVTWHARPQRTEAVASFLRFEKYPLRWFWRPAVWPVWNHAIDRAVRFWSHTGTETAALDALEDRRLDALTVVAPSCADALSQQLLTEHEAARQHLRDVVDRYDNREWRREHSGRGLHPDDHLWCAAKGLLDVDAALRKLDD